MGEYLLISDAAKQVKVESHVLRYWEEELHLPIKRNELGHRYYTKEDVERFKEIKSMKERGLQLKAIKMIFKYLPAAVNEKNPEAIEKMGMAQYIAGMGFSNVGLGIVHSMAHQLGAVYDTPHGIANAMLLPIVMRFNGEVCADRFREILINIGRPDAEHLNDQDVINTFVWMISELSKSVGITTTIKDYGAKEEDFEMLADKAMNDPCKPGNPREVSKEEFIELYRKAM